jgi:hypothetical protein
MIEKPNGVALAFDDSPEKIRKFDQIPDIMTMDIPPIDYLVDGMVARGTITLWAGLGGTAKSFLAQKMAIAVATGGQFLGRHCQAAPVLYLDYENPSFSVRERLDLMAGGPITGLKVWGTWLEQQPPQIQNEVLLSIAKETKPLIIVDPLRFAHGAQENDSTEMGEVMQYLRYCAAAGGAVVVLHHLAKTEGSTGRGSSAIRDHSDVAFVQEMSEDSGLITLKGSKNRNGELMMVTIRPNYDDGTFEVTDSPKFTKRADDLQKLTQIIEANPGLTQNGIYKVSGMKKSRLVELLKAGNDSVWEERKDGPSLRYFALVPKKGNNLGNKGTSQGVEGCSPVPSVFRGNREQSLPLTQAVPGTGVPVRTMKQCPDCHGFSIHSDGTCNTCRLGPN